MKILKNRVVTLLSVCALLFMAGCNNDAPTFCEEDPNTEEPNTPDPEPEPEPTPDPTFGHSPLQVTQLTLVPADTYGLGAGNYFALYDGVDYIELEDARNPNEPTEGDAEAVANTFYFPREVQPKAVQFYVSPASAAASFTMENYNEGLVKLITAPITVQTKSATEPFSVTDLKVIDAATGLVEFTIVNNFEFGSTWEYDADHIYAGGDDWRYMALKSFAFALEITTGESTFTSPYFAAMVRLGKNYYDEYDLFIGEGDPTALNMDDLRYIAFGDYRGDYAVRSEVTLDDVESEPQKLFQEELPYPFFADYNARIFLEKVTDRYPTDVTVTLEYIDEPSNVATVNDAPITDQTAYTLSGDYTDPASLTLSVADPASATASTVTSPKYRLVITNTETGRTYSSRAIYASVQVTNF